MALDSLSAVQFTRWFLASFFVFVALFYTVRILAARQRTGTSPVTYGPAGTRHRLNYLLFRVFRALILTVCVARLIWPALDRYLGPIGPLWQPWIILTGDLLLLASFVTILFVHSFMAEDWRSGIDAARPARLITRGPFAYSRNPMALLIQLGQIGLFLALPTAFTLLCLSVGMWVLHGQIRLEEAELERRLGAEYLAYKARVPRWIGRVGSRDGGHEPAGRADGA